MLSTARLPGPAPTGRQARLAGQRPRASSGAATATSASSDAVELIKKAAKGGFGQPSPAEVLQAVKTLERSNIPAGDDLLARLGGEQSPGFRWRLVYASGQKGKTPGSFFPIPACQRWDASKGVIENGVYLGGILGLIFQGPFNLEGRILRFDFNRLALRLGPWKPTFTIKQETNDFLEKLIVRRGMTEFTPAKRSLPLFKIIYVDDEVAVARGRSGGLAFWARTTPTWELENHVEGLD